MRGRSASRRINFDLELGKFTCNPDMLIEIFIPFLPVSFKCRKHASRLIRICLAVKTRSKVKPKVRVLILHCVFWNRPLLAGRVS
jgi:hypothetical protein